MTQPLLEQRRTHSAEHAQWRKAVLARDNWTCQECGSKDLNHLHSHHVFHWRDFPEHRTAVWNGITLCNKCHAKSHPDLKILENLPSEVIYAEKVCPVCGDTFHHSKRRKRQKRCCSVQCHNVELNSNHYGEDNPNWRGGSVVETCPGCGKEFEIERCKAGQGRCCSIACSRRSRRKGETRQCPMCGRDFYTSRAEILKGGGKHCSRPCFLASKGNK